MLRVKKILMHEIYLNIVAPLTLLVSSEVVNPMGHMSSLKTAASCEHAG